MSSGPAGQVRWRLHVLASPDPQRAGQVLPLGPGPAQIGRSSALVFDDRLLSRQHLSLWPGPSLVRLEDNQSRNGTFCAGQRVAQGALGHGAVLRFGATVAVLEADLGRAAHFATATRNVPGHSELARLVRSELEMAPKSPLPVLIAGETGTGKEHAAAEIHRASGRRGALVRLNVAAVPQHLFESELFGHVAGAFTGATAARLGRIREAQGGTLVLDEIGELPLDLQPKLLRVLEEGRVRPVGGQSDLPVDVRFLASTNADLEALVRKHLFRRDLAARLCGHVVHLPTLQSRTCDLVELADAVAPLPAGSWRDRLRAEALEALLLERWPDNLRSLRAVLFRAAALAGHGLVEVGHLSLARPLAMPSVAAAWTAEQNRPSPEQLRAWLAQHRGNIDAIARATGRHRRQVYRWLEYAGIDGAEVERARQVR